MLKVREHREPLLEENYKLICHFVELGDIAVGVDVTEAGANRVVDEEEVGELVPRAVVVLEMVPILQPVRSNLHHGTVLGAAAGATIQPDDGSLTVGDVLVLKMPKEEVAIVFWSDLDVPVRSGQLTGTRHCKRDQV